MLPSTSMARSAKTSPTTEQNGDGSFHRKASKTAAGVRSVAIPRYTAAVVQQHLADFADAGQGALVFPNGSSDRVGGVRLHRLVPFCPTAFEL